MSLNTRKKQVKPKVTIDQKEATISTGKKFKGAFSGIFAFFTKKGIDSTAENALTGEFTPPGKYFLANLNNLFELFIVFYFFYNLKCF